MQATPLLPPLARVPAGAWTASAWAAGVAFTFLIRLRLPGETGPTVMPGVIFFRWDGITALVVATAMALYAARVLERRPLAATLLLLAASAVATIPLGVGGIPLAQFLAVDVAVYFVASARARRSALAALVMALATLAGHLTIRVVMGWNVDTAAQLTVGLVVVIAWLLGRSAHQARAHAEEARTQAAARAVTAERLRIARELHDMVAHSIGIIALQAGAARRVVETRPAAAGEALAAIETAGRETLSGLRGMLGALRQAEPGEEARGDAGAAPLEPAQGLADLERLAEATTGAGVRVEVEWRGERGALPPEIDLSAYRIVQEAVTNVVRHAGADSCRVIVDRREGELSLEVLDRGRGQGLGRTAGSGWGLAGMRERVALLHGEFSAAPRPDRGFRVAARLPVPAPTTTVTGVS
ncbi:sensor histidine kinase [Streptomyces purpureus]|uniref:sensor histidine kinase n=1 Tax=Streptomyces purpureus TaxID=1951 RepID=UPI00379FBE4D